MNQLRSTSEMQSLGNREKRSNLTKLHAFILICTSYHRQQNKQCLSSDPEVSNRVWQRSSSMPSKERSKENEIQFLTEANLTPWNVARFRRAGRQRLSSAPLSREVAPRLCDGQRATSTFAGRPTREYARQVQRRSDGNAKACWQCHYVRRPRRKRCSPQRPRR